MRISMKNKTIILAVIALLLIILVIQNTHPVAVRIFFWEPTFPLIILVLIFFFFGLAAGLFWKNILRVLKKNDSTREY